MELITIAAGSEAGIVEKRSRFIADAAPVADEASAQAFIRETRLKRPGARHYVFAWRLENGQQKCSDDGEPQGTGGQPVLEVLSRRGLRNVAVVVTRYFGGVLLGAPGLLRAYTAAAVKALDAAETVRLRLCRQFEVTVGYPDLARLERLIAGCGGSIGHSDYGESVTVTAALPEENAGTFVQAVSEMTKMAVKPRIIGEIYCAAGESDLQ